MRTTKTVLALGATALAFGALAPQAAAADADHVELSTSTKIMIGRGACSLTTIDAHTAFTASHCNVEPGGFHLGDEIKVGETVIGHVGALGSQADPSYYVDVVRIDLDPAVATVVDQAPLGDVDTLKAGDTVTRKGAHSQAQGTLVTDQDQVGNWNFGPEKYRLSTATGEHGDSGGAVLDGFGRIIGVHSADLKGKEMFVPIDAALKLR